MNKKRKLNRLEELEKMRKRGYKVKGEVVEVMHDQCIGIGTWKVIEALGLFVHRRPMPDLTKPKKFRPKPREFRKMKCILCGAEVKKVKWFEDKVDALCDFKACAIEWKRRNKWAGNMVMKLKG